MMGLACDMACSMLRVRTGMVSQAPCRLHSMRPARCPATNSSQSMADRRRAGGGASTGSAGRTSTGFSASRLKSDRAISDAGLNACTPPSRIFNAASTGETPRAAMISRTSHCAPQLFNGRGSSGTVRATVGRTSASRSQPWASKASGDHHNDEGSPAFSSRSRSRR
jgi:hypothetical protein